jgi:hypothetical protein
VTFLDCAGIGAPPAGRNTAVGRGRGHPVGQPAAARAPGPGDHRCPQGARPARGFGAADRSGARSRRSLRRRNDRQVAAGPPPPSTANASASQTNASW